MEGQDYTQNSEESKQLKREFNSAEDADDEDDVVQDAPGDTNVKQSKESDNDGKNIDRADKIIPSEKDDPKSKDSDNNKTLERTLIVCEHDDNSVNVENIDRSNLEPLTHLPGDPECCDDILIAMKDNHGSNGTSLDKTKKEAKESAQKHNQLYDKTDAADVMRAKRESENDKNGIIAETGDGQKPANKTTNGENYKDIPEQGDCTNATSEFCLGQSNDFPMRTKADSFSVKEKKPPTPRKARSVCVPGLDLDESDMQGSSKETAPPMSPIKSFCE